MTWDVRNRLFVVIDDMCGCVPTFGAVLQEIRKAKQRNQQSVALRVNRSIAWVSEAENNHLPKSTTLLDVEALAQALDCHPSEKARLVDAYICHWLRQMRQSQSGE